MMFTSRKPRKMDEDDHHHGGGGGGRGHEGGGGFQKYQQRRNQYRQSKAEDINSSKSSSLQSYDHSAGTTDQSPQPPPPTPQSYHSHSGMSSHQSFSSRSSRSYYTEDDYTEDDGDEVLQAGGTNRRSYHSRGDSRRSQYTEDSRATTEYTTEGSQSRYSDEEEGSYYTEEDDGSHSQSRSRSTPSHHRRRDHHHDEYNDESYRSEETDEDSYQQGRAARGGKSRSKHSRNHHDDTGSEPSLSPGTATSDNRDKVTVSGASAGATTLGRSVTGSSSAERTHSKSTLLSSRSTLMSSASSFRDPPGVDFSSSSSTNRKQHYKADDGTVGSSEYGRNQTPAAYRTAATSPSNNDEYYHDRRSDFDREASSGSVVSSVISALPNVPPREEGLVPSYLGGSGGAGGAGGISTTGNTAEIDSLMFDASASHIAESTVLPMEDTTMADTTDPRDGSVTPSSAIMTTTSMMSDTRMGGTSRSNSYGRTSEMSFGTSGDETTTDDVTDSDIDYNTMMSREETETYRQRKEALERQRQMILNAAAAAGVSVASSSASASLSSRSGIASRTGTGATGRGSIPQDQRQQQQQQQYGSLGHSHTTGTSTSSYTTSEVTSATETTSSTAPSTSTHTRTTNVTPSPSQLHSTTTEEDVSDGGTASSSSSSSSSVSESESQSRTETRSRTESTPSSSTPSSSAGRHPKKKTIGNVLGKKAAENVQKTKTAAASTASSSIMSNKEKNPLIIDHERKKTMLESLSELTKLQKAVSDLTLPADLQSTSKGGTGGDNTANSSVVSSTHEVNSTHNKDDSETRATPSSLSESTGTTPSRHQRNVEQAAALQQQKQQQQQQRGGGRFYADEQPHMSRIVERGESKITDNEDTESTGTYEVKHRIESELEACKQLLANAESSKTGGGGARGGSGTASSKRHTEEQDLHRHSQSTTHKSKTAEATTTTTTAEERKLRLLREGIQVGAMAARTSDEDKDLSDLTMSVVANYATTPRESPTTGTTVKQQEGDKAAGVGVITAAAAARAAAMSPSSSAVPQSQQATLEEEDAADNPKHGKHHHHRHHHHHHSKRGDEEDEDEDEDEEEEDESETGWSSEDDSSSTHSLNRSRGGGTHKSRGGGNARSRGGDGSNSTTSGQELPETHIPFQKKKPKPMPGATEHICQDDDEERSQILFGGDALLLRPPEPVAPELLKTSSGEVHPPVVVATVSAEDHMREKQKQLLLEANAAAAAESTAATGGGGGSTTNTRGSGSGKLSPEDLDDLLADDEPDEDEHPSHPLKMAGVATVPQMLHSAPSGALLQKDRSLFSIASSLDESSGTHGGSSDRRDQFRMRKLTPDANESHSTFYTESSRSEFTSGERSEDTNGTPQSQTSTEHSESRSEYTEEEEESYVSTTTEDESQSKDRSRGGGGRRRPLRSSHASGTASTSDGEGTPSTAQGSSSRTGHTSSVSGTLSKTSSTSFIQTAQVVREGSDTEEEEELSDHKYHQTQQHFQRSKHSSRSDYSSKSGRSRNDGGSSYVSSRSATPVSSEDEYDDDDDEERGHANYKRRQQQLLSSNKAYQGRSTRSDSTHEGHHDDEFIKPSGGGRRFSIGSRSPKGNRGSPPGAAGGDTHSVHSAGNTSRSSFQKNGHWCCTPWYKPLIIGAFCIAIVAGVITAVALILTTKGGSVVQQQQGTDVTNVDVKQNDTMTGTGIPPPTDIELHEGGGGTSTNASTAFANLEWNIVSTLMDTEFSSPGDGAGSQVILSQDGTKTIVSSPLWSSPDSKHVGSVTIYDTSDDGRSSDGTSTTVIARLTGSSSEQRFGSVIASNANATILAIGSLLIDDSSEALSNTAARETTAEESSSTSVTVKGFEVTLHRLSGDDSDSTASAATLEPLGEPLLIDLGDQFSFPLLSNEDLNYSALSLSLSEDGTRLLVGTPLLIEEVSRSVFSGRIWIYDNSSEETTSSVWNEMSILKGSEPSGYIYNDLGYGSSNLILSGNGQTLAVVGSLTSSSPEPQQVIHLLKYDVSNERWGKWNDLLMLNMFVNHNQEEGAEAFSSDDKIMSIDMNFDGTILVVGVASASPKNKNYVIVFDLMKTFENDTNAMIDEGATNVAQLIGQVITMDPVSDDTFFGYSLDLSSDGTRLAVGSPSAGSGGAVYLYDYNKDENKWIQAPTIPMGDAETADGGTYQGYSVSLSDDNDHIAIGVPNLNGCDVSLLPETTSSTTTEGGPSFCEAGYTQIYQYIVSSNDIAKETSLDVMVDQFLNQDEDETENETESENETTTSSAGSSVVTLKDGLPEEASWPGCIIDQMTCEGCRAMIQAERKDLQVDIVREAPSKEDSTGKRYLLRKRQMSEAQETTTTIENKKRYLRRQMVEQDDSTNEDNTSAVVQVICSDDDRVLEEPKWNVQDLKN